jgi:Carboxypeptidase regulatory-like domain
MKKLLPLLIAVPILALFAWVTLKEPPGELPESGNRGAREGGRQQPRLLPAIPDRPGPERPAATRDPKDNPAVEAAKPGVIVGQVKGAGGDVLAGVRVYVTAPGAMAFAGGARTATDQDGAFALEVEPGTFDVIVYRSGLVPQVTSGLELGSRERRDLGVITLTEGLSISGRIVDEDGRGLSGASVKGLANGLILPEGVLPGARAAGRGATAEAADDGSFTLTGLVAGTLILDATLLGYTMKAEAPTVPAGEAGVVIGMRRLLLVTGRIISDLESEPILGASVKLAVKTRTYSAEHFCTTVEEGRFSVDLTDENLGAGEPELMLFVSATGYESQSAVGLGVADLSPEKEYLLKLVETVPEEPGTLFGRVLYDTGKPFRGFLTLSFSGANGSNHVRRATVDENGRFLMKDVPPGEYPLHSAPGASEELIATGQTVIITSGGREETEFTIIRGGDVQFDITDESGEQVPGAAAAWLGADGKIRREKPAREGLVSFVDLPPGSASFRITGSAHVATTVHVEIEKDRRRSHRVRLSERR